MDNKDQPAFPLAGFSNKGLTKRELFAAIAMQALVSRGENGDGWSEAHSIQAIYVADSLLSKMETTQ